MMKKGQKNLSIGFCYDDSLDRADGVSQYVKTVGAWLSDQGHEIHYLVGESKIKTWHGAPVYSLAKNLRVAFAGNRLSMPLVPKLGQIKKIIERTDLDILHVQVPYSPLMAQIIINCTRPETALVGTFHIYPANGAGHIGSKLLKTVYGRSFRRIDKLLSVSSAAQAFAKSAFGAESTILPNMVNLSLFNQSSNNKHPNGKHIVFLGRLVKRKGPKQLLEAFSELARKVPDARLTIAGDGPMRSELQAYVKLKKIDKKITFLGFVSEQDKPKILASADIACFPSLFGESFGIVLIEAMAASAGVVIGGNNPGYTSVLGARPEVLFDPANGQELAGKLEEFLNNRQLFDDVHAWQAQHVKNYDVQVVGPKLVKIYNEAIAKARRKVDN